LPPGIGDERAPGLDLAVAGQSLALRSLDHETTDGLPTM